MSDVFISYVEEDSRVALEIAAKLEDHGYTTWCYERDATPGADYSTEVALAIQQARAIVVVASPNSVRSPHVISELNTCRNQGKPLFPLLLKLSYDQLTRKHPNWEYLLGTATAVPIPEGDISGLVGRLVIGLERQGLKGSSSVNFGRAPQIALTSSAAPISESEHPSKGEQFLPVTAGQTPGEAEPIAKPREAVPSAFFKIERLLAHPALQRLSLATVYFLAGLVPLLLFIAWEEQAGLFAPSDIRVLEDAVSQDPAAAGKRFQLAKTYYYHGRYSEAIREYLRALQLEPESVETLWGLALAYHAAGRPDYASVVWARVIALKGTGELVYRVRAHLESQGYAAEALAALQSYVAQRPFEAGARFELAEQYRRYSRYWEAIGEYRECLRLKPDSAGSLYGLGLAYDAVGLRNEAVKAFRRFLVYQWRGPQADYARAYVRCHR